MERRTFVKSLAAGLAVVPFLPELGEALAGQLETLQADLGKVPDERSFWGRVRREFLLNPDLVHLNCGSVGSTPRLILDAMSSYMYQLEGDPVHNAWGGLGDGMEQVRIRAAHFIGADPEEIVLTRNTTEGMNAVATGLRLKKGDEVLTTNHEHGGGMVCWQYLARHVGVRVRCLKMPRVVRHKDEILELVERHLTRRTRACSFSHIDTITGLQMPMADIGRLVRPRGIALICDGAQVPGMLKVDVKELEVDAYASSSHKWMLAPKGSGLLYIRKEAQDAIQPVSLYSGYQAYSASGGTRNVAQILGHGLTMDFHNAIGRERVESRCRQLCGLLRERLKPLPGLHLLTPEQPELSSGIVTFAVDERQGNSGELAGRLFAEHRIVVKVAQGTYAYVPNPESPPENYNALRFSTHIFNSEAQVERTADILARMLA